MADLYLGYRQAMAAAYVKLVMQKTGVQLMDEFKGRQAVEVISAVVLDAKEEQRIREFVSKLIEKEVVITTRVDEAILGGVIIQVGDQLLDGSLRSKLEGLRREIKSDVAKSPG